MADAFGTEPLAGADPARVAIRVHGDYHLRRVMRTDGGWLVAGFGDDPLMGAAAGAASQGEGRFASPLEDVADLCCSLQIATAEAVGLQTSRTRVHAELLARGWQAHNMAAFVSGYLAHAGIEELVPGASRGRRCGAGGPARGAGGHRLGPAICLAVTKPPPSHLPRQATYAELPAA